MDVTQNVSTVGSSGLNFQKIVLIIAVIILIVSLVFIGIQIKKSNSKQVWPPFVPDCPDFWAMGSDGKCYATTNAPPSSCNNPMNFTENQFAGRGGACEKRKWASDVGCTTTVGGVSVPAPIAWEGITYGTKDPC
jgi:hypothetical protein